MDTSKMKNMVVLKNLPSNIIDEAIVILKPNKKIKSLDYIEKTKDRKQTSDKVNKNPKDYILQEAEMIISNYISNIEDQRKIKLESAKKLEMKYKKLRILTFILASIVILNALINNI